MHNPLALLTKESLDGMIQQGNLYFVRQAYARGYDHFETGVKGIYLFSHYRDREMADKHYKILKDQGAAFYDVNIQEDKEKLYIAADQPVGYRIYSALLKAKKWEPTPQLGPKIKQYIRLDTKWKLDRSDTVRVDLFIQFGELFLKLRKGPDEIKVPLSDVERY